MIRYPAICLLQGQDYLFVFPSEITHVLAEDGKVTIFIKDKDSVQVSKSMKEIESLLPVEIFLRVHHSAIINLMYVDKYHPGENNTIELIGGNLVPLSRRRKSDFLDRFTKF
jgi:two-component system LytT family response regulator